MDENVVRTVAFYVIVFTSIGLVLNSFIIPFLVAIDFAVRAFSSGAYSVIRLIAKQTASQLHFSKKPIDAAPKKFSAGLGFIFSAPIGALQLANFPIAASAIGGILLFCAVLESFFGICLGCIVYTAIILPFKK